MKGFEPFFFVEDHLSHKLSDISEEILIHDADEGGGESKSKYKGGFVDGKNTKAYNHDYYIHNKDKWKKKENLTIDELKELGFTDEEIEKMGLEKVNGVFVVPTSWVLDFMEKGTSLVGDVYNSMKDTLLSWLSPKSKEDDKDNPAKYNLPESPYDEPKTLKDPQVPIEYSMEVEDQRGNTETITTNFDYVDYYDKFAVKKEPMSIEEDMKNVNPSYNKGEWDGYSNNCAWCTYTYELRRRGYDVTAPYDSDGMTALEIAQFYKDTTVDDFKEVSAGKGSSYQANAAKLFDSLKDEGNGARGNLSVFWNSGGGHSMAWEVVDGTPYVLDTQTNTSYDLETFTKELAPSVYWDRKDDIERINEGKKIPYSDEVMKALVGCSYLRTDNRELNTTGKIKKVSEDLEWNPTTNEAEFAYSDIEVNLSTKIVSHPADKETLEMWNKLKTKTKHSRIKNKSKRKKRRYDQ